ncbi:phosphotransferase IIA-like nitrogen-regulatory protein PtsN [Hephaestia caeni]|uniref:Phosphotransferase IIA-like nitrogen-regulatory protein PtsN n=1 Tax=Hephaestia caeni TaxID=645617 RepID=A0A397P4C6_9SPHN|nr:PTS sugar transporter subunit IIA [Hephaestia caeni]RIA44416.1 phosphotransferase IIA-like nitrogen-regulatory protein PtsN [Hephaestia caeni]
MTDFSDILRPDTALAQVPAPTKKHLFQALATAAGEAYGLDPRAVTKTLAEREKLGSTGFGGGVAIPHGRVEGLDRVVAVVAQLAQPIDYQAIDDLPVDLAFMLLSPPQAGADHLKALARVSRGLRDAGFVAKLRGAGSPDALYALLTDSEARDAA